MTFFLPIGRRSFLLSWRLVEALCVPVAFERVVWVGRQGSGVWRAGGGRSVACSWRSGGGWRAADMSSLWDGFGFKVVPGDDKC